MNYSDLRPQEQDSVIGRAMEAKSMMNYHETEIAPNFSQMEAWEQKEYKSCYADYTKEFNDLVEYITETNFDDNLLRYGHTTASFVSEVLGVN